MGQGRLVSPAMVMLAEEAIRRRFEYLMQPTECTDLLWSSKWCFREHAELELSFRGREGQFVRVVHSGRKRRLRSIERVPIEPFCSSVCAWEQAGSRS